jgi:hypothetical protein
MPVGVFYVNPNKKPYHEAIPTYRQDRTPLWQRSLDTDKLAALADQF